MKSIRWTTLTVMALVLALSGCASADTATPVPTIALDPIAPTENRTVQASAEVVPSQQAHLGFVVPGSIKEIAVGEGDIVEAGQILATLGAPDLEYGILQAEAALREAEFDYEYWKLPRRVGGRVVKRGDVAAQELETTRKSLETAQAEFEQTKLIAPFAATVVSVVVQPGEYVQTGQVVIVLANLDTLKVETTDLSELNVATVNIDQPALVYVEALDTEFHGIVTAISPISDILGGDVVFKVTIQLEEPPLDLLWGMSADVEIQTEQ